MSPNLHIAIRFLLSRKRSMLMSLAGIVFGVGFFIVTQAQTSGFEEFFIRTVLGTDGAIRVEDKFQDTLRAIVAGGRDSSSRFHVANRDSRSYTEGVENPRLVREALVAQFSNIAAISEIVRGSVIAQSALRSESAQVLGIDLDDHLRASNLENQIILGDIDDFRINPIGALIGTDLAQRLQITVGETIILSAHSQSQRFRIEGIFQTGSRDIDKVRLFVHMGESRALLKRPYGASYLQISLFDRERATADAMHIENVIQHSTVGWKEREEIWLDVFKAVSVSFALTVSTIILISGLGMFNALAMIVMEKTREIAILRSMGYTRSDISRIFLWQGAIVLFIGTVFGWIVGAALTFGVSRLPIRLRGIFTTDTYVVDPSFTHYVMAALIAAVFVMVASIVPARRAARLEPGDVIRGTST